jgi:hypothetical protein
MADMAGRLRLIEKKLSWIMDNMRMRAVISSGLTGPDGNPLPGKAFEGSLSELWMFARQLPTLTESEAEAPPVEG